MELKIIDQIGGFGFFCLFGAVLGVYYTGFKLLRYFIRFSKTAIFFQDILFFVSGAVATFIVLINVTNGEVRGYILVAVLIGFALFYFTLGALAFLVGKWIIDLLRKIFAFVDRHFFAPVRKLILWILRKLFALGKAIALKMKKILLKCIKPPKKIDKNANIT